jgi:hypothetical protein
VEDIVALAAGIAASLIAGITVAGMALAAALLLLGGVGVLVKGVASIPVVDRVGNRVVNDAVARLRGSNVEPENASQDDGHVSRATVRSSATRRRD